MALLTLLDAELAFGLHPLLDRAGLTVLEGERIGLIGRNGTGKSSLLKIIAGLAALDDGKLKRRDSLRVVLVEQEPELPLASSLRESLAIRGDLNRIHDERERWRLEARLVEYLHRFGLDSAQAPDITSGGECKRAALALALARQPDLLLLDEPTNHLDIDGITLLEDLMVKGPASIVITHDRAFLDRVVNRIVELDRGLLRSYPGNFAVYEIRKADQLATESVAHRKFDKFWAQEEVWIRKGIKARRTRNEGRVRRLENCGASAQPGASVSATSNSRSLRASARVSWWRSWSASANISARKRSFTTCHCISSGAIAWDSLVRTVLANPHCSSSSSAN